ncbi:MAG: LLM class flavin-dependent oxidoreductase [Anaerolineae bacterium]|nr:LLM class flavin-dependent oxidoreductase [Anaerolineae bacterium]
MAVEFGLVTPAGPLKGQTDQWKHGIDTSLTVLLGYVSGLWVTDHFFWDDEPTFECWTAMAYLSARWPQLDIGSAVLGQGYRNPALTAKMAATLQTLSNGRLIFGIGAGWKEDEHYAYGYPFPSAGVRVEQLEDTLEIITRLWTQPGKISYQGKHYSVVNAYCEPKPDPVPLLVVGGGGDKTTRLAARFADWWNIPDASFDTYSERMAVVQNHCAEIGRDPSTMRYTWFGRLVLGRTETDALARGGNQWTYNNALFGTPEQVVQQMGRFVDAGVDYFMVGILDLDNPDVVDMLITDVLPYFP